MDYSNDFEEALHGLEILEFTLPSVFPSSQSSTNSDTPILAQDDISQLCDRDCSVYWQTDDLDNESSLDYNPTITKIKYEYGIPPPHFENSSLALSPISNPPKSPAEVISVITNHMPESPAFSDTDDDFYDIYNTIQKEGFPVIPDSSLCLYLDFTHSHQNNKNNSFNTLKSQKTIPNNSYYFNNESFSDLYTKEKISYQTENSNDLVFSFQDDATNSIDENNNNIDDNILNNTSTFFSFKKPTNVNVKVENQSNSSFNSITGVKSGRGRKRKSSYSQETQSNKKKCQNKEAARRYRDKKKIQEKQLEDEEKELLELVKKKKKTIKELEIQHKFYLEITQELLEKKGIRVNGFK